MPYWEAKDESIVLPEEFWDAAAREQEARLYQDPWADMLADVTGKVVGAEERIFTKSIFDQFEIPMVQREHYKATRIAESMRKLGWDGPKRIRIDGKSLMGYVSAHNGGNQDDLF